MTSMRGRCAEYKEDTGYKPFIISNSYEDGRRIIYHKHTGLRFGDYKKALKSHKKMWAEVMDEIDNMEKCFVCERVVINDTNCDWCENCREKEIWRCEYCNRIVDDEEYDNTYIGGEHNAICSFCRD